MNHVIQIKEKTLGVKRMTTTIADLDRYYPAGFYGIKIVSKEKVVIDGEVKNSRYSFESIINNIDWRNEIDMLLETILYDETNLQKWCCWGFPRKSIIQTLIDNFEWKISYISTDIIAITRSIDDF